MPTDNMISRRDFIKIAGTVAAGSVISPFQSAAKLPDKSSLMPTRPFGNTGINVPILSFGGSLHLPMLMLRNAYLQGVTYWDTAGSYMGGNSEKRIGKYFDKFPQDRREIFLVTKSHAWSTEGMTDDLNRSLERMQTDYVDLFFVHSVRDVDELDENIKNWSEKSKAKGKIRFFGFSTHSNMEECMRMASKLGWIDGIMMSYNFRLMHSDRMRRAVDACVEAGIGLTAMKTQGGGSIEASNQIDLELAGRFLRQGYTAGQAKLKAVWENKAISSICSEMPNMNILMENVSAALDRTKISNETVYIGSNCGKIYALDARMGELKWTFQSEKYNIPSSATVDEGIVFFNSDGRLRKGITHALDAATGQEIWRFDRAGAYSSPYVDNGVLFIGSSRETETQSYIESYALDVKNGKIIWKFERRSKIVQGLLANTYHNISDGVVYFGSYDGYLYAVDIVTGEEKWKYKTDGVVRCSPFIDDGVVYFGSNDGYLYSLSLSGNQGIA